MPATGAAGATGAMTNAAGAGAAPKPGKAGATGAAGATGTAGAAGATPKPGKPGKPGKRGAGVGAARLGQEEDAMHSPPCRTNPSLQWQAKPGPNEFEQALVHICVLAHVVSQVWLPSTSGLHGFNSSFTSRQPEE